MPKVSEIFGGAYLKAEHYLNGQPRVVTIDGINVETIYSKKEYVLYLLGEQRGHKLSPTCANDIVAALGLDEMEAWSGQRVELYSEERTITDRDTQTEKQIIMFRARAAPPSSLPGMDDDIPF